MTKEKNNKRSTKHGHDKRDHVNLKSIYIYKTKTEDGKRPDKRTCVFYDKKSEKCLNEKCSKNICASASNCGLFGRRKRNENNSQLSDYDENYLSIPEQSGIHDTTAIIGMGKNIGTPVHGSFLKSDGIRRHKARCIYYDKVTKLCKWFIGKCHGSSQCEKYEER